ncbi:hypothetical protein BBW65_02070 [Helicobacter enhydrae]|uniref:Tetratricopeptide repeat-like domain-containing protein n=1 Tax=Helicobacter enhydrae TaxID=222136 RepID=A0A1B1U4E0_9HELI|nr:hypothetical protein [Helicobacter enhydrae]ANV97664.1 hypothetical protein BBW65_02070 [Helicobacter enhydrae]
MKIKEEMQEVKNRLENDEKMLVSVLKIEKILKKYKGVFFAVLALLVGGMGLSYYLDYQQEERAIETTRILDNFLQNPSDEDLMSKLQSHNQELYEIILLAQALQTQDVDSLKSLKQSSNAFVATTSSYELASLEKAFLAEVKYQDYQDLANLEQGYLLLLKNQRQEADALFDQIEPNSPLRDVVLRVKHYGITH